MVPVVAPAMLVRVRLGPGLRTLETCNMQPLGGRKTFSNLKHMTTAAARHPNMHVFGKMSCKYSVLVHRADTLWEHRMYFMKASEDALPKDLIWLSDMPWAAAVVAAPIRKLRDLNNLGQK